MQKTTNFDFESCNNSPGQSTHDLSQILRLYAMCSFYAFDWIVWKEDGDVNSEHSLRYAHCTYSYTNTMQSTHTHRVNTRPPWLIHPHLFAFYLHISPKCRWKFVVHSIRIHGSVYYMRTKACCWSSVFIWRTRHGTWKSHSSTIPDTLDFRCTVLW